jgi:RNA polymerase sigma factor (TIGR02999 family)
MTAEVTNPHNGDHDPAAERVTLMLNAAGNGDPQAAAELLPLVYDHLRALAGLRMSGERRDHTLAPTALVSEAYLKLVRDPNLRWNDRVHFFNAAAQAMRRILVDHARARGARRRALDAKRAMASLSDLVVQEDSEGILSLDEALTRLEEVDATAAQVVRLRFFAGLSVVETAEALAISERTVMREWAFARAWLLDALKREEQEGQAP